MPQGKRGKVSDQEMYEWYVSHNKDYVDKKTFKKVLDLWGKLVCEMLLEGKDVPLYSGFLSFGVRKQFVPTYLDHRQSKLQGKKVMGSNSHSDYYGARVYWAKRNTRFNVKGWHFMPNRFLSRALAAVMKSPGGHKRFVQRVQFSGGEDYRIRQKIHKI